MSDTLNIIDMNQIAVVLSELVQNYNELARYWYDVFHDPAAKDITVKFLDVDGNLRNYTIPNRAKDRSFILHGDTDPEGNVFASTGSLYQNTKEGKLFFKLTTEGNDGSVSATNWKELKPTDSYILNGKVDPEEIYPSKDYPYGVIYANMSSGVISSNTPDGWQSVGGAGTGLATVDELNAVDNKAVHIEGRQFITGEKIFENHTIFTGNTTFENYTTFKENTTFEKIILGTAYRALSADIAEYYEADAEYQPGTLVQFGGEKEVTIAKEMVNAVVSTNPAYILNGGKDMEHPTLLALSGRVPVRVKGKVEKFDLLKLSEEGVAIVDNSCYNPIGRALETNLDEGEKLVECVVKLTI